MTKRIKSGLLLVLLFVGAVSMAAPAQVLDVSAGGSTLFGGSGAGVTAFLPNNTVAVGGGIAQGKLILGASDSFKWHGDTVTAGTQMFNGSVEASGLTLQGVGVSFKHSNQDTTTAGFIGSSGIGYANPYFGSGSTPQNFGAAFYFQRKLQYWTLGTLTALVGNERTAVQSVSYARQRYKLSGSGGVLQNSKYATASGEWSVREALHLSAAHQENFYAVNGGTIRATSDTAAAFVTTSRFQASAVCIHSLANGQKVIGYSGGVGAKISFVTLRADAYRSETAAATFSNLVYTAQENLGWHHLYVSETASQSRAQGTDTVSFSGGGGIRSNRFSVDLSHSAVFIPFSTLHSAAGFQQTTSVNLSFRIHDLSVNTGAYIPRGERAKFSVGGDDYIRGPMNPYAMGGPHQEFRAAGGRYVVRGIVRNSKNGEVVEGAAVMMGHQTVFSNASGLIFMRTKKASAVTVHVSPEDFAAPGRWRVVSAAETVTPAREGLPAEPFTIVVEIF